MRMKTWQVNMHDMPATLDQRTSSGQSNFEPALSRLG
jgi:hypothetical protein